MTTLIIARHGNTFGPNDTVTYVGGRTDLPLVESGRVQAMAIGQWLKHNGIYPDTVYSSELRRTRETAEIALKEAGYKEPVYPLAIFNEIDYGPDENKTKEQVIARITENAHSDWDKKNILPNGWKFNTAECIDNWQNFARHLVDDNHECVLVVTSNGIARFAPHITGNFDDFARDHAIKLSTGALAVLEYENGRWVIKDWNIKPQC
jgi:2,3-bisphosphoglycerate-dependent phosphoglycerate mutase